MVVVIMMNQKQDKLDKNRHFLTPSPFIFVHIVIEWPLKVIIRRIDGCCDYDELKT